MDKNNKQYGLIVPGKEKSGPVTRPSIFNEDSDEEAPERPTGLKRPLKKQDKITRSKAIEEDPTVYQYDEIYDEMDQKRKESKLSRKDLDRKPKYISRLLVAAEKRKRENERRIERQVQKEREAEGEEFKDKESFVTSAYKKKLEEMRELEEQEKREEYLEAIGDVKKQGNLDGFYRHLYDQKVNYEDKKDESEKVEIKQEVVVEEEKEEEGTSTSNDKKSVKRKYRRRESSDKSEDEKVTVTSVDEIKKEHLQCNLDADSDFSIDSSDSEDEDGDSSNKKKKEDKNDDKVDETVKNINEDKTEDVKKEDTPADGEKNVVKAESVEEKKPKIDIWKKRTVGEVFDAALQRYFERKAVREL